MSTAEEVLLSNAAKTVRTVESRSTSINSETHLVVGLGCPVPHTGLVAADEDQAEPVKAAETSSMRI